MEDLDLVEWGSFGPGLGGIECNGLRVESIPIVIPCFGGNV